ncbi:translesion DNA synthesis-associated protein ImuA [Caballeronia sp. dw_19]|uniref:translesion DNA synthesis-associated protein ImuA n=1 Tax=Caballeronia sp. dw_19 TaxID=2719791 RepID=UPI001BD1F081|nr:translesion DNA synthesis-associated protein ImuA [Caballeronia sp. dw_19]
MGLAKLEDIHPSLWLGSQLARAAGQVIDTGYETLSAELPGGGWPVSTLIELLVPRTGIGEMRVLRPALASLTRPIALVKPPQVPQSAGFAYQGVGVEKLIWLKPQSTADALWSVEQILRAGSFGAVIFWQQHIRSESLRRLMLAAQSAETLFFLQRPVADAMNSSPATLRLAVRPAENGVSVEIVKRKGPASAGPIVIRADPMPALLSPHTRARRSQPREVLGYGNDLVDANVLP